MSAPAILAIPRSPRATLPEEVANRVLALIESRQLRPGDRLPPERELGNQFGVSRFETCSKG